MTNPILAWGPLVVFFVAAAAVVDVEVDVVGVGLPVEDEAQRGAGVGDDVVAGQLLADRLLVDRLGGQPGGGDQAQVLVEDADFMIRSQEEMASTAAASSKTLSVLPTFARSSSARFRTWAGSLSASLAPGPAH